MAQSTSLPRLRHDPDKVVRMRIEMGFNQKNLAASVGISPAQMCRIEMGKSGASVEVLHRLAKVLDCKVTALMPAADTQAEHHARA
jgi:DNA-binding XRE family transcriptional regulator